MTKKSARRTCCRLLSNSWTAFGPALGRRLEKAQQGNLGDVGPVGEGVFEMREFFGPGWRMYYWSVMFEFVDKAA